MAPANAALLGAAMIAGAILVGLLVRTPRYEISPFSPQVVARMDASSGKIELCGAVQSVMHLTGIDEDAAAMRSAGISEDEIGRLSRTVATAIRKNRCFVLNRHVATGAGLDD